MKAREGDILRDLNGIMFDVKGLVHPQHKVVAFPRFIPDLQGNRVLNEVVYSKIYSIQERFKFLEQNLPHYVVYDAVFDEKLCEVPLANVKHHYRPVNCLREFRHYSKLDDLEKDALSFLELLKNQANVPWSKMGISGSLLVKLHTPSSDIDPIIYGGRNCRKIHEALKFLTQDPKCPVKAYNAEEMRKLFDFRVKDTKVAFRDFVRTESRKTLQGKFENRDYFIRFIKDWNETESGYGETCYKNVGYCRIKAIIEDGSEAIFTPCSYKIRDVKILEGASFPISEIASFRGRFCEQARVGDTVIAQGKVEHVVNSKQNREHFRLLLGNKPSDFMILA